MKNILIVLVLSLVFFACKKAEKCVPDSTVIESLNYEITDSTSIVEDDATLAELGAKIKTLSESKTCSNEGDWIFIGFGSKACGGVIGYLPFSTCINTNDFVNKVNVHAELQRAYNVKYEVVSICDVPPPPTSVECVNDKPVLVY